MRRARLVLCVALLGGAMMLPGAAHAQYGGEGLGSAVGNNAIMHQGRSTGIESNDITNRAAVESPFKIIKDVKLGLHDADPNVRVSELTKLRPLQDPEADRILMQSMNDPDIRVKIKAIDVLGARETNDGVDPMSQALFLRSTEPIVKLHLVAALGRIGDAEGVLPVMQYLSEQTDPRARGTAVFALGEMGDDRALGVLSQTADEDPSANVRRLSKEALQKIDGELPNPRVARAEAKRQQDENQTTAQKLAKLREMDQKAQEADR